MAEASRVIENRQMAYMINEPVTTANESSRWLDALRTSGPTHDQAIESLYELLLRGARFEVSRRRAGRMDDRGETLDDIATQAADTALVAVLAKLDSFRGESRFTTWAYKFALLEAAVSMRRRAWQEREVMLDSDSWARLAETADGPDVDAERAELLRALSRCIGADLTQHQRQVLVLLALDGVPVDVLAERLCTTRGALYKTLHDARRKLRDALADGGLSVAEL
jgi:RNA polymerase sigma-70 factor (ECF subfamily)